MSFTEEDTRSLSHPNTIRAKQNIVFCVLIVLFNATVIIIIFTSHFLRRQHKFHVIASISLANITAGLAYFPFDTMNCLVVDGVGDETLAAVLNGVHLFCVPSVLALSLTFVGIDYCVNRLNGISASRKITDTFVSLWIPWIYGALSLVLLSLAPWSQIFIQYKDSGTTFPTVPRDKLFMTIPTRYSAISYHYGLALVVGWGFLPLGLASITIMTSFVLYCVKKITPDYEAVTGGLKVNRSVNEDALAYAPKLLDTGVAVVVIVFVNISYFVSILSDVSCTSGGLCKLVPSGGRSLELARWSISFLLPTLWLLDGHFRNVCAVICGKVCIGVTYR